MTELEVYDMRLGSASALLPAGQERTPEWYRLRREGIGASDMPAVLGLSSYASPFSLYWSKRGLDVDDGDDESMTQRLGRQDETGIAQIFTEMYPGWEVNVPPASLWRGSTYWMLATPDRLLTLAQEATEEDVRRILGEDAHVDMLALRETVFPLEMKSYGGAQGWGPDGSDEVPLSVAVQVLQQCLVFGSPFGVVMARLNKQVRVYVVHVSDHGTLIETMIAEGARFMQHVASEVEPVVDGHEATTAALRLLYPADARPIDEDDLADAVLVASTDLRELARLRAQIKRAREAQEAIRNRVREQLGKSRVGIDKDGLVVAKRSVYTRRPYSVKEAVVDQITFTLPGDEDE